MIERQKGKTHFAANQALRTANIRTTDTPSSLANPIQREQWTRTAIEKHLKRNRLESRSRYPEFARTGHDPDQKVSSLLAALLCAGQTGAGRGGEKLNPVASKLI